MIKPNDISIVYFLNKCIEEKNFENHMDLLAPFDAEELGEALLTEDTVEKNKEMMTYQELLTSFINICSYIENETSMPDIISDELYDKLVEKTINLGNIQPIGSSTSNIVGIGERPHKFPELRGSLAKVHFIYEKDIPKKDSRKSLEGYLNKVVKKMKENNIPVGKMLISVDKKRDGVSHIIECESYNFIHVLTRGDVVTNMGKDLTPLFAKFFPIDPVDPTWIDVDYMTACMDLDMIPWDVWGNAGEFGIKVETYMKTNMFERFKDEYKVKRCNRRSAVMSICNQSADNIEPPSIDNRDIINSQSDYLTMDHFQISSTNKFQLDPESREPECWFYAGLVNGRHQYIYVENPLEIDLSDIPKACEIISKTIDTTKELAEIEKIPIDGAVITLLDTRVMELLGRKDNKNMFQVAFKFPAGIEKTIIEDVDFQVGPVAGKITPVARLKPIIMNGNTVSNVTLSNKDKMDRLKIRIGDEVIIKYDIVPTIFKDDTCKESKNELVKFPENCPVCEAEIKDECCSNPDCPAKVIGHILNFVTKVNIKGGLGFETIVEFVNNGILTCIGDIYRLRQRSKEILELPNFGLASMTSILNGINDASKLLPHQLLGSIGIPYIGRRTFERLCRKVDVLGNIDHLEDLIPVMKSVSGIGDSKIESILLGIENKKSLIEDLCKYITILPYEQPKEYDTYVCFSNVRDAAFEEYLETKKVKVEDSFVNRVQFLIIPDNNKKESSKIKKAIDKGIPIITLSEAKRKWEFNE